MTIKLEDKRPDKADFEPGEPLRWRAVITFNTNDGVISDVQTFEEIEDLHQIIEDRPNFYAIRDIVITINPAYFASNPRLKTTLESSCHDR